MPREKPRTQDETDAELDAWQAERTALQQTLSGQTESIKSLQTQLREAGTSDKLAALTGRLDTLATEHDLVKAALATANETIAALKAGLPPPSPPPAPNPPKPDDAPPAPNPPPPAAPRKTRTGVDFL